MTEQTMAQTPQNEPELKRNSLDPRGVLRKNAKALMYLGVALLVILAAVFSSRTKPTNEKSAATQNLPPQPTVQDNTDNNIQDLKSQLAAERQHEAEKAAAQQGMTDPALSIATPAQRAAAASYSATGQGSPCLPGQPCVQQPVYGYAQQPGSAGQPSPAQQASQQIAAKDRERAYESRFSSNLAYSRPTEAPREQTQAVSAPLAVSYYQQPGGNASGSQQPSTLFAPRPAGEPAVGQSSIKRGSEVNIDSAAGQPYVIYEGSTLDAVLMNRLDSDAVGPVKVLVSNPLYSHDRQHILIPDGTIALGEAKKIGSSGFGQQRRMAVVFHRMIMPDGYSVDLDQFHGLDQIGEEGLKDKVNNHYVQIFGASIALGVIAGAAQISQGGGVYASSGPQVFTNGASASVSQSATTILDRFMQIPPTITIREGHRVKVYFTQDMLLPAYENHTIPGSF
jgi:type IV secretion system protein VirB10